MNGNQRHCGVRIRDPGCGPACGWARHGSRATQRWRGGMVCPAECARPLAAGHSANLQDCCRTLPTCPDRLAVGNAGRMLQSTEEHRIHMTTAPSPTVTVNRRGEPRAHRGRCAGLGRWELQLHQPPTTSSHIDLQAWCRSRRAAVEVSASPPLLERGHTACANAGQAQVPSISPSGLRSSTRSHTALSINRIGTPSSRPHTAACSTPIARKASQVARPTMTLIRTCTTR